MSAEPDVPGTAAPDPVVTGADAPGAILPSVVALASVSAEPISVETCAALVEEARHGAVVTFAGVVRDHDEGKGVTRLGYEGHPDAERVIGEVARSIAERWPDLRIAVAHRVGELVVGDVALAAAVASPHRAEAFAACSALVDEVKLHVPIWKEQSFTDGTTEWVGSLG